jgi:hypothetical protein
MMAETRGVKIGCGQTLSLMVSDLKSKIKLRWLQSQEDDSAKVPSVSDMTLPRLLGSLQRMRQILFDNVMANDLAQGMKILCSRVRDKARRGPIFLPKFWECRQDAIFPGEIITSEGGFPSILRVFLDGDEKPIKDEVERWFEFCIETKNLGPMIFTISRSNGKLSCRLQVLDEKISNIGKSLDSLALRFENAGYQLSEIAPVGLNQDYPDILNLLDRRSEDYINYRV